MNSMEDEKVSIPKIITLTSFLLLISILAFLFAKYMVRGSAGWESPPVDVSEKA